MRQAVFALVFCLGLTLFQAQPAPAVIPAVVSSVGKAILKYFGKQGSEEAVEYLSRKGGQEMMERVVLTATRQGGDEAVEQVAKLTGKYGPDAIAALDNVPSMMPLLRTLDELPSTQVKSALTALAAGKPGRELAEAVAVHGGSALRMELKYPGVGLSFVRGFGDEGVELASKLTTNQSIVVARHADDIAKLPAAQRAGVVGMLRENTEQMVGFVGRFVEANPGKVLFSVAGTTVILAEPERILGGDEIVFDADGNPVVMRKGGIADRTIEAGGKVAAHVSTNYLRPVYLTVMAFVGVFVVVWGSLKYWTFRKIKAASKLIK
ncbi:MAG: hypothetical protein OSA98_19950 [Rubripirellula sp.]|nr:hypothetical protein [Rubripirellula sp.]